MLKLTTFTSPQPSHQAPRLRLSRSAYAPRSATSLTLLSALLISVSACSSESKGGSGPTEDAGVDGSTHDGGADASTDANADAPPVQGCGDGVREGDEACDGDDLGAASCATELAPGWVGALTCTASCTLSTDGCSAPATTYAPLEAAGLSAFDVSALDERAFGYRGAGFDGRYLYLVPNSATENHGVVARYDTQASFSEAEAWSSFDAATVDAAAIGFQGAAFDGTYLYLIPARGSEPRGTITRYDTRAPFEEPSAWQAFNLEAVSADAKGFSGAGFDGRYLYLVPRNNGSSHGLVARFDTQATFDAVASWSVFDLTGVHADARGYEGVSFDGRYLYLVPFHRGSYHGLVARLDTQADFMSAASWKTFDLAGVHADARGYHGAAFDGRYLYLAPLRHQEYHGRLARLDTQADFEAPAAWSTFDLTTLDARAVGYQGVGFDGRHLYLVPFFNGTAYHGQLARFDTEGPLEDAASWSFLDLSATFPNAVGFFGAAFDGAHLYLVPSIGAPSFGQVVRFNAKSPAWLPPRWNASFF